ncbi:hypothetical protein [Streptomyces sp. NPDC088915]|uniref:hypothetical protein n=1 Tax=Streptomyces sp. NPDC088915 TaxID=3365912 RepID=UPI0038024449
MPATAAELRETVLASLTTAGFTDATAVRHNDTMVIATVPVDRRPWAEFALLSHTALRLADKAERARYAVFTEPDDTDTYTRVVYFRATGPGLARQYVDKELCHTVRITPGYNTEADIPKALAVTTFGTVDRADDITVTRLA